MRIQPPRDFWDIVAWAVPLLGYIALALMAGGFMGLLFVAFGE